MRTAWPRAVAVLLLIFVLVVALVLAAAWAAIPFDGTTITVDGETFRLADLTGSHPVVFFTIAVAAVVFALLVALSATAFGLGLGALGLAFGLLVTLGTVALVAAPFALALWLLWRLARPRPATRVAIQR